MQHREVGSEEEEVTWWEGLLIGDNTTKEMKYPTQEEGGPTLKVP